MTIPVPTEKNINIGCGLKWAKQGWIGVDKFHQWPKHKRCMRIDISNGALLKHFPAESIERIYTSHTLEHFTHDEAIKLLSDFYKIMKPDGIIRIVVPDLDICVEKMYKKDHGWWSDNQIQTREGARGMNDYKMARNFLISIGANLPVGLNREDIRVARGTHFATWNFDLLEHDLRQAGFKGVVKKNYGEYGCTRFNGMDNRPKCSLHVEATKST